MKNIDTVKIFLVDKIILKALGIDKRISSKNEGAIKFIFEENNISDSQLDAISKIVSLDALSDVHIEYIIAHHPVHGVSEIGLKSNLKENTEYDTFEKYLNDNIIGHEIKAASLEKYFVSSGKHDALIDFKNKDGYILLKAHFPKEQ